MNFPKEQCLICSLDVGSTKVRICLYNSVLQLVFALEQPVKTIFLENGRVEINSEDLWITIMSLFESAVFYSHNKAQKILILGLSTQRNTFISWNKLNLEPCHSLISWKDSRGKKLCSQMNNSITKKLLNLLCSFAYCLTRSERFKAAKMFNFVDVMVLPRFLTLMEENAEMKILLSRGELAMGCLDSWLILKLSEGRDFVTTHSCASSTGLYDPFIGSWGKTIMSLFRFPIGVLPRLVDEGQILGTVSKELFGTAMSICASLGDSQAAVVGSGCLNPDQIKVSLGTGTFVDLVVGATPLTSFSKDIYPLVGWSFHQKFTFLLETKCNETASVIEWAKSIGLFFDFSELCCVDEGEIDNILFFFPIRIKGGSFEFTGGNQDTTTKQKIRAMLEGLAFSIANVCDSLLAEFPHFNHKDIDIRCCGGVSMNDFICSTLASVLCKTVRRVKEPQYTSAKGVALAAGINAGFWMPEFISQIVDIEKSFYPKQYSESLMLIDRFREWKNLEKVLLSYS